MNKLERIKELVAKQAGNKDCYADEEFEPMSDSGGNFDDAFEMGSEHGAGYLAREVLAIIEEAE